MKLTTDKKIKVVSSIIAIISVLKKRRKQPKIKMKRIRKVWSHDWLLQRDYGLGLASMVIDEMRLEDPDAFNDFARMTWPTFSELLEKVSPIITKQNTLMRESISSSARLLLTIRHLATGENYTQLAYGFRISKAAISIIVPETINALYWVLKDEFFKVPRTADEWKIIANDFEKKWNFPFCLGALDGKHIAIKNKADYGSLYYNYRGFHSVIFTAVVDANYNFLHINIASNERANDTAIFTESFCDEIPKNIYDFPPDDYLEGSKKKVPFVFVADDAFQLSPRVLKPYEKRLSNANKIFNNRLNRARSVAENAIGMLANKFQIIQKELDLPIDRVEKLVLASCALHNFILQRDGLDSQLIESWREEVSLTDLQRCQSNRSRDEGRMVRNTFAEYFNKQNDTVQ
ncbi:putative nuclease HARBI1 isoform X1 [Musca domestica]|uniref:Nuclease HARBI1 isoform X1 n=2 Tax=Musca domestica TaxID=7370 RepID=A0ABM3VFJ2_MUSDO|nr:putative nuclease HARBI1 isoform X1 [Musca domestica]